jgi:uncharacterized protein DUF4265
MRDAPRVKITLPLSDRAGPAAETYGPTQCRSLLRVRNVPMHAYDLSNEDTVAAHASDDGRLTFDHVIERGGHSTYRIIPASSLDKSAFQDRWAKLQAAGCSYESTTGEHRYAVDVAPSADIHAVYSLLEKGEDDCIWDFEEGHCGHKVD